MLTATPKRTFVEKIGGGLRAAETFVMGLHKTADNLAVARRENAVILKEDNEKTALPLDMFMRTERNNNFTHGIYGLSYFSCYCVTFDRFNTEAVISYKYF
jgi:hypothetical protein